VLNRFRYRDRFGLNLDQQDESPVGFFRLKRKDMHTRLNLLTAAILLANAPLLLAQEPAEALPENEEAAPAPGGVEEISVVGRYIPQEKRSTASISNVLDAEMFDAAGDSSVAEGLKRVSGLNLQGGRYIYIRGLGERYSSTVLNGSTLPSPEPINRVVPLDLFPSGIIDSVLVQKTFSAQYPAEFAGGTIQIRTKVVPDEPFLSISTGIGYAGNTTGKNGLVYDGGDDDWTGTDDGTRDIPPLLKDAISGDRELRPNSFIYKNGFAEILMSPTTRTNLVQSTSRPLILPNRASTIRCSSPRVSRIGMPTH
jgi:outer membrane receptor protein involved in Fe transport